MMTVAYIDPGAGAMVLQWIIAAVFGGGIFFRRAIGGFFGRLFGKKDQEKGTSDEAADDGKSEKEEKETGK